MPAMSKNNDAVSLSIPPINLNNDAIIDHNYKLTEKPALFFK